MKKIRKNTNISPDKMDVPILDENIVTVRNVSIDYKLKMFTVRANENISINIKRGCITALVGESGSGKTTLASAIINCISDPGQISEGEIEFHDKSGSNIVVNQLSRESLRRFRWEKVSMVFQGAQSALNPVMTIFSQFYETMKAHDKHVKKEKAYLTSEKVLKIVNLDAERILKMYPHELSGGMKQRVMIAFSLLLNPQLIILDEPTTALDVITQEYIFNILKRINKEMNISMLLLTHDIAIVAKYSDYIGVMYAGKLMEYGRTDTVFEKRYHPYTSGLIRATPSLLLDVDQMKPIEGIPADLLNVPSGCVFHPRCLKCMHICKRDVPPVIKLGEEHYASCHLYHEGGKTDE